MVDVVRRQFLCKALCQMEVAEISSHIQEFCRPGSDGDMMQQALAPGDRESTRRPPQHFEAIANYFTQSQFNSLQDRLQGANVHADVSANAKVDIIKHTAARLGFVNITEPFIKFLRSFASVVALSEKSLAASLCRAGVRVTEGSQEGVQAFCPNFEGAPAHRAPPCRPALI